MSPGSGSKGPRARGLAAGADLGVAGADPARFAPGCATCASVTDYSEFLLACGILERIS